MTGNASGGLLLLSLWSDSGLPSSLSGNPSLSGSPGLAYRRELHCCAPNSVWLALLSGGGLSASHSALAGGWGSSPVGRLHWCSPLLCWIVDHSGWWWSLSSNVGHGSLIALSYSQSLYSGSARLG